ncbi:MAG: 16S rRNA (guanine(966)-N(2))-methyltransferase RsmD [Marmoricola sp.]
MTRIIGGAAGGRRLKTPPGEGTRPTSDRVREALFSALESQLGTLTGHSLLDLYAGSGAIALEALSRGAASATAVESDRRVARLITANAADLGLDLTVIARPVEKMAAEPARAAFDVVFADPPYPLTEAELAETLEALDSHGWVGPGSLVVIERSARSPEPTYPAGWETLRERRYGETVLWYVRLR